MVKRTGWMLTILVLLLVLFFPSMEANAADTKQRIYDHAEILSADDIEKLEATAAKYSDKRETDFMVVTLDNESKDIVDYVTDFYEEEELGYDQPRGNTAIIAIDIHETKRDVFLSGFGKAEEYLDPDKLETIRGKVTPALSDGDYEHAFNQFITLSAKYITYKPGSNPANPFYNTWVQLIISIALGAAIVWMLARNPGMKVTTNHGTYRNAELTKLKEKKDRYIRTTVTKKRKPKPKSGGGGGRSSGGGFRGSTGGGRSFSGSRGKF